MQNQLRSIKSALIFGQLSEVGFNKILKEKYPNSKKIILTDDTVAEHWLEFIITEFDELKGAEIIQIPSGEENKVIEICTSVWEALSQYEISRNDIIINLGGGVICDMGGFIASCFKRGVRFINIPTTLLAQVDASVGGKTAIDLGEYKNQIGLFSEPEYVFIDTHFLSTLPTEQLYSGYAEMIKHGLIFDKNYWNELKQLDVSDYQNVLPYITTSVNLKKTIIASDYFEKNQRKKLNFGHTIGHAIEGYFLVKQKPLLHGFAVAYGMMAESFISLKKNLINKEDFEDINLFLKKIYGSLVLNDNDQIEIIRILRNDKKNDQQKTLFTLLDGIGTARINQEVNIELIGQSLMMLSDN